MGKISWHQDWLYLDKGESRESDTSFEFWWSDYDDYHIEIMPTNIIKGNRDFGKNIHRYVFFVNRGLSIGHTSPTYDTAYKAKVEAKRFIDTANMFGVYSEKGL